MKVRAAKYLQMGEFKRQQLLGGNQGLAYIFLLAVTGLPAKLGKNLGHNEGAPTLAQAAGTGIFSLR